MGNSLGSRYFRDLGVDRVFDAEFYEIGWVFTVPAYTLQHFSCPRSPRARCQNRKIEPKSKTRRSSIDCEALAPIKLFTPLSGDLEENTE